jgi:hypothetical protein
MTTTLERCALLVLLLAMTAWPGFAEAGAGRGKAGPAIALAALAKAKPTYPRPLGPTHVAKEPIRVERYTHRPATDRRKGLAPHSFWTRPHPGRKGSADYVRRRLNIPHQVTRREEATLPKGTAYHERPVKGGRNHSREVIVHQRVPRGALRLRESPAKGR